MSNIRLAQPEPHPERLLAHARKIAKIALRATDTITGDFLIDKAEEQYALAIRALDGALMRGEAAQARIELEEFSAESRFLLHDAPVLAGDSAFRKALDILAASEAIGPYYNGTNNVDEIADIARKRMARRDRLGAAEDATRAATCLLWRAHREEEAKDLYNEFTDVLVREVKADLDSGQHYLVETKSDITRKRLVLTGRKDEADQLENLVSESLKARPMGTHVS